MQQMNLFDVFFPEPETKLGDAVDASSVGDVIPFSKLKDYIDKDVIYDNGFSELKIVRIVRFYEDCEYVYRKIDDFVSASGLVYEEYVNSYIRNVCMPEDLKEHYQPAYQSSRVAYTDNPKRPNTDLLCVAEHYCSNGRNDLFPDNDRCCFYTIHQL